MTRIIRCKMRVMSIDHRHDKSVLKLSAVIPHSDEPENATFHKYTPCAELSMEFPADEVPEVYQPNACYYLDMVRCEKAEYPIDYSNPNLWLLSWGIKLDGPESRAYTFERRCWSTKDGDVPPFKGEFALSVDNPDTFETFGIEGDILWTFDFKPALTDYSFYISNQHQHVLGEPTYDDIVRLSGVEGEVKVQRTDWNKEKPPVDVTRKGFGFLEHANYIVTAVQVEG